MKLSTKARYGLRALCHVAHRGHASAQSISERQGIPSRYLEEIIGALRKAGLVVGKRGPRGGYRLARPAAEIDVSQIVSALSPPSSGDVTSESHDELASTIEHTVDERLFSVLANMRLDQLITDALERQRRSAANYVI
jgi:Rrf2 family protein